MPNELGLRALNRALLARQLLLRRHEATALAAVEHLVGMQSQAPMPPYYGLWTRLAGFRPDDLARLLLDRQVVRIALMRGTVHLVTAADALELRPLTQPVFDRDLRTNAAYARDLAGLDREELAAAGRVLVEQQPRTAKQLRELLANRWPGRDAAALAHGVRDLLPLVQVPPRGVWGAGGQARSTTAEHWLGRPMAVAPSAAAMLLRYLAAFGPASVADMQKWSGLSGLAEIAERLRPRLVTFRDDHDRELFDLPEAPRPEPDAPAPVRFVPEYDNLTLSHADRSRIVCEERRRRLFTSNGLIRAALLVDGFVVGMWKIARAKGAATLRIEPFGPLADRSAVVEEGARLLEFAAPGDDHDIRFGPLT